MCSKIRVCMIRQKIKQIQDLIQDKQKACKITTHCTQAPLGFHPLCCLKMAMVCMLGILAKQKSKQKDRSPSMTLSKSFLKTNDLSPLKLAKDTWQYCYHGHTMTHAHPV